MRVEEIMTPDVITVSPDTPIHKAAGLMVTHRVSGLPVVDERGAVIGIVSDGDLIVRQKARERISWWRRFLEDTEQLAAEYRKTVGTIVADVMTREVITVGPDRPIESAALLLDRHRIRRLPVVADGKLVGIVSRADLIKGLTAEPDAAGRVSGAGLVAEMKKRLAREPWAMPYAVLITATNGVLSISGLVWSEAEKAAVDAMARAIEGCTGVENHLVVESGLLYRYGA